MNFQNYFKDKFIYVLSIVFIVLAVINIIFVSLVERGLTYDGTIWFVDMLQHFDDYKFFVTDVLRHRPRQSVLFVCQLPVNLINFIFPLSKYWLGVFFTVPLVLFPFLCTVWNYKLAKRSGRYDLVVLSLFLYSVYVLPASMYLIVEAMLAACVLLVLFHYLCAKIDYTNRDIFWIFLLVIFSYNSNEFVLYTGPLMFLISLYYFKNETNKQNKIIKMFIGINCLLYLFAYILFYLISPPDFMNDSRITLEILGLKDILFSYENILDYILYIAVGYSIFKNKNLSKLEIAVLASLFAGIFVYYIFTKAYENDYAFFSRRMIFYFVMPAIIFVGFAFDYFKDKFTNFDINIFIKNILILTLLLGTINLLLQINWSYQFKEALKGPLNFLEGNNREADILIAKEDMPFLLKGFQHVAFSEETYLYDAIIFQKNFKIKRAVLENLSDIKNGELFCTKFTCIEMRNKYWDITELRDVYKEEIRNKENKK